MPVLTKTLIMKLPRFFYVFLFSLLFWSCSDDDMEQIAVQPSFNITASPDNPNLYYFENTTPDSEDYYSFWDFSDGQRILDEIGLEEREFTAAGDFKVTLNIVTLNKVTIAEKTIRVQGSGASFCEDDVAILLAGTCQDNLIGKTWVWSTLAGAYGVGPTGAGGGEGHDSADPADLSYYSHPENGFIAEDGSTCVYDDKYTFRQDLNNTYINQNNGDYYWVWSWANLELGLSLEQFADGCYESPEPDSSSWSIEYRTGNDGNKYPWLLLSNNATIAYYEGQSEYQILDISAEKMVLRSIAQDPDSGPVGGWRYYTLVPEGTDEGGEEPPVGETPENLLLNGDLELGSDDDFTNWGKLNGAERLTAETIEVYSGARGLKVINEIAGNPWDTQFASDVVDTEIGEEYTASIWIKGDAGTVRFSTNAQLGEEQYVGDYTVTADWTQYSWTFTANTAQTALVLDMGTSMGTYYVDTIGVVKGDMPLPAPTPPVVIESLVLNGNLELGDGDDFTNWGKLNGGDRLTAETSDVYEGSRALKVVNPEEGNPWDTQFSSDAITTEIGVEYTASVWVKGETGTIRFSTNAGLGDELYAGDHTVTADWTQYSWVFTPTTAQTTLVLDMGASAATYTVDLIEVVKNE